jgi:hypothetical protein
MTTHHHEHEGVAHTDHNMHDMNDRGSRDQHAESGHGARDHDGMGSVNVMAVSATLHCLTGCAIGEIAGLVIGTAAGLSNLSTIVISIALAFLFGYTLSTLPLLKAGLAVRTALSVVLAADTLSIATMELFDNLTVAMIPGAMNAGLVNATFWVSLLISLVIAFGAAYPVNRFLLQRGKGHALTHEYHGASAPSSGFRRFIPSVGAGALAATILAFILGGLLVSIADGASNEGSTMNKSSSAKVTY